MAIEFQSSKRPRYAFRMSKQCTRMNVQQAVYKKHKCYLTNGEASLVHLVPLASNSPCQLHVLGHDGLLLSKNGAKVGVLEQVDRIVFSDFLQNVDGQFRPAAWKAFKRNMNIQRRANDAQHFRQVG
jgi:hypothetical protein